MNAHELMYEYMYVHTQHRDLISRFVISKEKQDIKNIDIKWKQKIYFASEPFFAIPHPSTHIHTHTICIKTCTVLLKHYSWLQFLTSVQQSVPISLITFMSHMLVA
jgi:hypothetical protein